MLRYKISKRKKGQVGETVTWIIATLVIIGILIIFLVVSSFMSKVKAITVGDVKTDLGKELRLTVKTSIAEQLNPQNKSIIENILKEQNG